MPSVSLLLGLRTSARIAVMVGTVGGRELPPVFFGLVELRAADPGARVSARRRAPRDDGAAGRVVAAGAARQPSPTGRDRRMSGSASRERPLPREHLPRDFAEAPAALGIPHGE